MLERSGVAVKETRQARKEPLSDDEMRKMLRRVSRVVIARGRKADEYAAKDVSPDMVKGRSGSVRAPLLIRGKKMLVGFSADTLEDWFGA